MTYYVYNNEGTGISKIHLDANSGGCGAYENRQEETHPDKWWSEPFSDCDAAFVSATGTYATRMCEKCDKVDSKQIKWH